MIPKDESLTRGKNYRVVYRIPGEKPRRMVATLLGLNKEAYLFSGRPDFGTTPVQRKYVRSLTRTSERPQAPRTISEVRKNG